MVTRLIVMIALCVPSAAVAQFRALPQRMAPGPGAVRLPYQVADASGTTWMIYHMGMLQQQGAAQIYSQGAMLTINGNQPVSRANTARLDEKTGEVIVENLAFAGGPPGGGAGVQLTRRILINKEEGYARYVDVFKNTQNQDRTLEVLVQSSMNLGITASSMIEDPRKNGQNIAWVGQTGSNKCALEVYAGKGTRTPPNIVYQQGNSNVQATLSVTVPANKEAAIVHIHAVVDSTEAGTKFVQQLKESKMLQSLPMELRKIIVNFAPGGGYVGDRELLRGDLFDVVEIRGGDQMRGTLKEPSYKLQTFYGAIDLPADRVIAMLNVGEFKPRQLLVTDQGEVFGGYLAKNNVTLELSSGQVTQIPLAQVSRLGYRKRSDEPEEFPQDKPFVLLRSGDRVNVELSSRAVEVLTRYGKLSLEPKSIATIAFEADEHGVHEIYLADGTRFAGLVSGEQFEMKLAGGGSSGSTTSPAAQQVSFPASAISRIQFTGPPVDADPATTAALELSNDDLLVGTLASELKLETAFDTLTINGGEIRKLTRAKDAPLDVQVTLWDSSIVSGQLHEPTLKCQLATGLAVSVPISLLAEYNQPQPAPAKSVAEKIKVLVAELNADDWKQRDKAEADLTSMGTVVVGTLKQLRAAQPPEAQQRIDQILANLGGKKEK